MQSKGNWRSFLKDEFSTRLKSNPRYSLRAFARDLELSPGKLSELLNGKRALSPKTLSKIAKKLNLSSLETRDLILMVHSEQSDSFSTGLPPIASLEGSQFSLVSDWYFFAILNFLRLNCVPVTLNTIARRLGLKFYEVKLALEKLKEVGLIKEVNKKYQLIEKNTYSPLEVSSKDIRKFHKQMLQKASEAIDLQPMEERHYEGVTLPLDMQLIPKVKEEISEFIESLLSKYSTGKKRSEVYHMELAFFRLTEKEEV